MGSAVPSLAGSVEAADILAPWEPDCSNQTQPFVDKLLQNSHETASTKNFVDKRLHLKPGLPLREGEHRLHRAHETWHRGTHPRLRKAHVNPPSPQGCCSLPPDGARTERVMNEAASAPSSLGAGVVRNGLVAGVGLRHAHDSAPSALCS